MGCLLAPYVHSNDKIIPSVFTTVRMATTIAKAVVGSKVKSITKDIEGAIGLGDNEEEESEAVAEFEHIKVDKGFRRKQQQREGEREREREREN